MGNAGPALQPDQHSLTADKAARLDILVENTGRLNSTKHMREEWKGMTGATLDGKPLTGMADIFAEPMDDRRSFPMQPGGAESA